MLWTALLKTKQTKKKTAATFDRHMTEDNIRPVYRHFLLRGIILPSLSHASQTWLIKFHSGARCNYTHARTHMQTQNAHTHIHTRTQFVLLVMWYFKTTYYSKLKLAVLVRRRVWKTATLFWSAFHYAVLGPSACFLVCGVLNDGVRVGLVFKFYVLIAALKRLPATGQHFFFLHKSFMVTGHNWATKTLPTTEVQVFKITRSEFPPHPCLF